MGREVVLLVLLPGWCGTMYTDPIFSLWEKQAGQEVVVDMTRKCTSGTENFTFAHATVRTSQSRPPGLFAFCQLDANRSSLTRKCCEVRTELRLRHLNAGNTLQIENDSHFKLKVEVYL